MSTTLERDLYNVLMNEASPEKVQQLIEQGVDCNFSHFDSNTQDFVSPIQLAANDEEYPYQKLDQLYKHRNRPTRNQLRRHLALYYKYYQPLYNEENDILLCFTVSRLLHTCLMRYSSEEFHILNAAVHGYDDAKLRRRNLCVGSTQDIFLQLRIFALFHWIVQKNIDFQTRTNLDVPEIVEDELLHNLETYYFVYDIRQIPNQSTIEMRRQLVSDSISSRKLLVKFYRSIAKNIIAKIKQLRKGQEYTIPTGWQGHAVCVSLRRISETHISIRVDNPSIGNPPNEHNFDISTTGIVKIESKMLGQLNVENLDANLSYFIRLIESVSIDLLPKNAIPFIYNHKAQIQHLEEISIKNIPSIDEQADANCFMKCFEPGLRIRFGEKYQELCEEFLHFEKNTVNLLIKLAEKSQRFRDDFYDDFSCFARLNDVNNLSTTVEIDHLQNQLKNNYKKNYKRLPDIMNRRSRYLMIDKFVSVQFKYNNTYIELNDLFIESRILILGDAGCGKTTLCQYATYAWAQGKLWQNKFDWLFHISLKNLNSQFYPKRLNNYTLIDIIERECFRGLTLINLDKIKLEYQLAITSKILWILDGCDERIIPDYLCSIERDLFAQHNLLLTSRPYKTDDILYDVQFDIEGFTHKNITEYIQKYFSNSVHPTADECLSFVRSSEQLRQTASIPGCLELICILWDRCRVALRDTMTVGHLYEKMCEYLLRRYLLKFHGLYTSALVGKNIYQHPSAQAFTYLEYLAFEATKSCSFCITGQHIEQVAGTLFQSLLEIGLLKPEAQDSSYFLIENIYYFIHRSFQEYFCARYIIRILTLPNSKEEDNEVLLFIADKKYSRDLQNTFGFIFELNHSSLCMDRFWSCIDCEPRDLVSLRHWSRISRWFSNGICSLSSENQQKINRRTIDAILVWLTNKNRRAHDFANTYIFEWFVDAIGSEDWMRAWRDDLLVEDHSIRRYFLPDIWSDKNISIMRRIYDQISKTSNIHALHRMIKNGLNRGDLQTLQIDLSAFSIDQIDHQFDNLEFLVDTQEKAKRRESINDLDEFKNILKNYSAYAQLNREDETLGKESWKLIIDPSIFTNINNKTLELLLKLSQENILFFRDFELPVITLLELYSNRNELNENILCSLLVSSTFSSTDLLTAPPGQEKLIRIYRNEKLVSIKLEQRRWSQLIHTFDEFRQAYGYSSFVEDN